MKRYLVLMLFCLGVTFSDFSSIAQAADCSCYTPTGYCRNNGDGAPDRCGSPDWADYSECVKNTDYCKCVYLGDNDCSDPGYGTDPGDGTGTGLTQAQLDAIAAVSAALSNLYYYEGDAAGKLAA